MRLLLISLVTLVSSFSFAQQVKVETGTGGVQVDTGPGGVRVDTGTGTTVKTKAGNVSVKTGQGATTVKTGGANVRVETKPGAVNVVVPPAPAPAPAPAVVAEVDGEGDDDDLVIQDNGQTIEHTCGADQLIIVNGNDNTLTLHGPCKDLHVNGARNRISTDLIQSIIANGDANQIGWRAGPKGKNPKVSTNGNRNAVSKLR